MKERKESNRGPSGQEPEPVRIPVEEATARALARALGDEAQLRLCRRLVRSAPLADLEEALACVRRAERAGFLPPSRAGLFRRLVSERFPRL